jgi:hypothetical protein
MHTLLLTTMLSAAPAPSIPPVQAYASVPSFGTADLIDTRAWDGLPYPLGTETALAASDVAPGQARLLSVEPADDLVTRLRLRLRSTGLSDGQVARFGHGLFPHRCTILSGLDWRGNAGVHTYEAGARGGAGGDSPASLVLVSGRPDLGALVPMVPGDVVDARELRVHGEVVRESLSIRHGASRMTLTREGDTVRACFVQERDGA